MKRKILIIAAVVCLFVLLTACGAPKPDGTVQATETAAREEEPMGIEADNHGDAVLRMLGRGNADGILGPNVSMNQFTNLVNNGIRAGGQATVASAKSSINPGTDEMITVYFGKDLFHLSLGAELNVRKTDGGRYYIERFISD